MKEALKLALEMVQTKMYAHAEMYLKEALAQPAQEPRIVLTSVGYIADEDDDIQVYQRPWVGLTDEEHITLHDKFVDTDCYGLLIDAIEAKLKEKNT